nr:hypothetical protein [Tanacetum cinerariifolium]
MSEGDCSQIIDNLPRRLSEVKYIPGELLNQRLSLDEVLNHYWLYDLDTRIAYIKHLSDALKVTPQYDKDQINLLHDFPRSPCCPPNLVHAELIYINEVRYNIKDEEHSDLGETNELVEADFRKNFP